MSFDTVMSPDSWFTDDDLDFCVEIMNLRRLREINGLPEKDK